MRRKSYGKLTGTNPAAFLFEFCQSQTCPDYKDAFKVIELG